MEAHGIVSSTRIKPTNPAICRLISLHMFHVTHRPEVNGSEIKFLGFRAFRA